MTLLDFFRLIRKYLPLIIVVPVLCVLACLGYLAIGNSDGAKYTAQSRIIVSTHVQEVGGLAQVQGRAYSEENEAIKVTSYVDSGIKTVVIIVDAPREDLSVEIANAIADDVLEEAFEFVPKNYEDPFNARVEKAEKAKDAGSSGHKKLILIVFLAGLFIAICIVIVIDTLKRPVKSVEGIQRAIELPVLEKLPVTDSGERLLANIRFASKKDDLKTVCLIPVGNGSAIEQAADALRAAASAENLETQIDIQCFDSLANGMKAAYEARTADATLLVAVQWDDSLTALESAAAELRLANANLVGVVFAQ